MDLLVELRELENIFKYSGSFSKDRVEKLDTILSTTESIGIEGTYVFMQGLIGKEGTPICYCSSFDSYNYRVNINISRPNEIDNYNPEILSQLRELKCSSSESESLTRIKVLVEFISKIQRKVCPIILGPIGKTGHFSPNCKCPSRGSPSWLAYQVDEDYREYLKQFISALQKEIPGIREENIINMRGILGHRGKVCRCKIHI